MNCISCIVQILEVPIIEVYDNTINRVHFKARLPYVRNKIQSAIIIDLVIWEDLAYDIISYYQVNDYVLINGYLSLSDNNQNKQQLITLTVIKFYPYRLI